ncbi:hypothetical protein F5141DRAFT_1097485 [Pisolithus sp. B1]|nr:hypothetical protein F5141DRAFT_1097485 [Pisolithus sp. B1]
MCSFLSPSCPPVNPCKQFNFSMGVGGFFGGEATTSTVVSMLTGVRRGWLGWYDSPGSYAMGKRFRHLAWLGKVDVGFDSDSKSAYRLYWCNFWI